MKTNGCILLTLNTAGNGKNSVYQNVKMSYFSSTPSYLNSAALASHNHNILGHPVFETSPISLYSKLAMFQNQFLDMN